MAISPTADIGANLQRLRGMRGLTQEAAAEAAGLSRAAYRNLETGLSEPRASTLVALAKALGVSPADLLLPAPPPPRARFGECDEGRGPGFAQPNFQISVRGTGQAGRFCRCLLGEAAHPP